MYISEARSRDDVVDRFVNDATSTHFKSDQQVEIKLYDAMRLAGLSQHDFKKLILARIKQGFYPLHQISCMDERVMRRLGILKDVPESQEIKELKDELALELSRQSVLV